MGYDVEVKDELLSEALEVLHEKRQFATLFTLFWSSIVPNLIQLIPSDLMALRLSTAYALPDARAGHRLLQNL